MRTIPFAARFALVLALGCGLSHDAALAQTDGDARDAARASSPKRSQPKAAPAKPATGQPPSAPAEIGGMPTPPVGAQWSIYCQTISGADHVKRSNFVREQLVSKTALRDWYVVHGEGQSTLYYGFYKNFNEANDAESRRAQEDRLKIDAMSDEMGNRPFKFAFFVALDAPDPIAPPEWNLVNADGAYTLQIAAYTGSPLRKQYAVEAVRQFRAQGVEAYYYHGDTTSSICIGAYPESALRRDQMITNADGDPEQPFLRSTEPLPPELAQNLRDNENKPVRVVQDRPKVLDPTLRKAMETFPEHAINGEVQILSMTDQTTGKKVMKPADSFVVPIPHAVKSALSDPTMQGGEPMRVAPSSQQPGVGKLKSIGE